jgi:hypothetical protein
VRKRRSPLRHALEYSPFFNAGAVSFCVESRDAVPMLPVPLIAFGVIAALLGIIALLPDFERFSDE